MLFNEVDAKLEYYMKGDNLSPQDVLKKRFNDLTKSKKKNGLFLDKKNVLRQRDRICPNCFSVRTKKNGYHSSKSSLLKKLGISINIGQYKCIDCEISWSIDAQDLFGLLDGFKEEIRKLAVSIMSEKNSLHKTSRLLSWFVGKRYSHTSINRWYKKHTKNFKEQEVPDKVFSGYYVYDEQEIKVGGKKKQRLMLRDVTHKTPFVEELADDKKKETIRKFLVRNLADKKRVSVTVDGDPSYPDIFTKDLKMTYQHDIRHLFNNITKDFKKECAYGVGHKHLHLIDELKKQELFDLFYPREKLILFVKEGLKKLNEIKDEDKREEEDKELQKELRKIKHERRKKRRRKGFVHEHKKYTLEKVREKFDQIKLLKQFYPKPIQKKINKIDEELEHYTLYLIDRNVPPTSNFAEQYFSSTLQRSEKKKFRNEETFNDFLKIERLKKTGILPILLCRLSFIEILRLFLEMFLEL